jgi:hypothetical protein
MISGIVTAFGASMSRHTRHRLAILATIVTFVTIAACGGSKSSSSIIPTTPSTPSNRDPCATTAAETSEESVSPEASAYAAWKSRPRLDPDPRWSVLNSLWIHRTAPAQAEAETTPGTHAEDVGNVAVIQDTGDIITQANAFDLTSAHLKFTSNGRGYDVSHITTGFKTTLGTKLTLTDDDTSAFTLPFTFNFFGTGQTSAFVNSDGNITFGESDTASTDRSVSRFLTGAPRVAPFFTDLDPSTGSGRVYLQNSADGATITWCAVRGFESTSTVTVQAVILPDGSIEFHYGSGIGLKEAVIGLSPGHTGQFEPVDLSASGPTSGGTQAVGERFSANADIDLIALAKRFYQTHADNFDQIVIFTDKKVVTGNTFAYESTVANEIGGLGIDVYDVSRDFGSAGRLRSVVMMDALTKYPDNPSTKFLGENNTVSLLGQEAGHRWLAFLRFRDANGRSSTALLGRDMAHWSFFFDSDASVMEGNDIEDLGGGSFRTVDAVRRYSLLDQYAMGLVSESQVPDFFYVESPVNVSPPREATDDPEIGVTFNGTRRDVKLSDVTTVMGHRSPAASSSPRVHRQAFVYLVSAGASVDGGQVSKVEAIRKAWVDFFYEATSKRMTAQTSLQ